MLTRVRVAARMAPLTKPDASMRPGGGGGGGTREVGDVWVSPVSQSKTLARECVCRVLPRPRCPR